MSRSPAALIPLRCSCSSGRIGLNAGAAIPLYRGEHLQPVFSREPPAYDLFPGSGRRSGVSFGAQAGYNWQIGRLVYGLETDINLLDGQSPRNGYFLAPKLHTPGEFFGYSLNYEQGSAFFATRTGWTFI